MEPDPGHRGPSAGSMLAGRRPETRVTTRTMSDVQALHEHQSQQAREQAREQAQQAREQIREQAQQMREQAQRIREEAQEAAREAQHVAEEAAREARAEAGQDVRVIRMPPPPTPPGQEPHIGIPPWQHEPSIPGEVVDIVGMLTFATAAVLILRPLMRAFANRFERRGAPPTALPVEVTAHMDRLEQAIEAVAIEVERISEGQRYTTKLLAERAGKDG
jgi:multidrug efflux pump subunit AcrA (membrane-fusion protein)